jgi:hypothetical protein
MDIQSLIESFGILAVAPGIAIYLHQSFVKITQQMLAAFIAESAADRLVFRDAVEKLDSRIQTVEQVLRNK